MALPRKATEKRLFDKPWTVLEAIERMDQFLMGHHSVFEWGAGSSTLWFAERCKEIVSVESDQEWFDLIVDQAEVRDLYRKLNLVLTGVESELYVGAIDIYSYLGPFDLIFIDGKAGTRAACARRAVRNLSRRGMIVLDNSGSADSQEANWVLEAAGLVAERMVGPVYDPRLPREQWDKTETAFWTRP